MEKESESESEEEREKADGSPFPSIPFNRPRRSFLRLVFENTLARGRERGRRESTLGERARVGNFDRRPPNHLSGLVIQTKLAPVVNPPDP